MAKTYLEVSEVESLEKAASNLRDKLFIRLIFRLGCRVSEALAYVSNAALAVPLSSEWADIYQYLLTRVMGDKVPKELRKESLDEWGMHLLVELKQWIWKRKTKARDERARQERAKARAETEARAPKQLRLGL